MATGFAIFAKLEPVISASDLHPDDVDVAKFYRFTVHQTVDQTEAAYAVFAFIDAGNIMITNRDDFSVTLFDAVGKEIHARAGGDPGEAVATLDGSTDTPPWE